jgi:hypothetical protein
MKCGWRGVDRKEAGTVVTNRHAILATAKDCKRTKYTIIERRVEI